MDSVIAAFDFDGTVTKKDTFFNFLLRGLSFGIFLGGSIKSLPILFLYALRKLSADDAKERIFGIFFKNMTEEKFNQLCSAYSLNGVPRIIRKQALQKIQWHRSLGHELVIVSASIENWIKPWAKKNNFDKVISTIPEVKNGLLTGRFKTKNCNREEKVNRFLANYPNKKNYRLYVYGDDSKDKWLFEIADEKFYRTF